WLLCLSLVVMRCQPLRRALAVLEALFGFSVFYSG
ncbi:superoxide dismutase, partial [Vibrio cholerae]|nr:superoxide dismutase [Vibrio cholerae]